MGPDYVRFSRGSVLGSLLSPLDRHQLHEAFIRVEFPSVDQAKAFREKLLASGALERGGMRIKSGPTVAEVADQHTY